MAIRITSDSTCDLDHLVKDRDIGILSLQVNLGDKAYHDGVDITPADIFQYVAETKELPKTSAPSIGDYEDFFKEQLAFGDEILHFNISAKSSGSHNFAKTAAESFGGKVRVIDSMALSSGQGLLVLKAADLRDEGKSIDEIEETILALRDRVNTSFVPDRLDYLYKGGRCSKMEMFGANILKIHPLIYMEEGKLVPGKKYRGKMNSVILNYAKEMEADLLSARKDRVFITHSGCDRESIDSVKEYLESLNYFEEILITRAGGVVSSHCGPGTLGVLFIDK